MNLDEVFTHHIGEMGRFQGFVVAVLCAEEMFMSMGTFIPVFIAAVPDYWCDSLSSTASPTLSTPHNITAGDPRTLNDQCVIHHEHNIGNNSTLNEETVVYGNISHCNKWQYSKEIYTSTIVTEWDLVCDRAWLVGTSSAVFMAGWGIGSLIFGFLADRFGRRYIVLVAGVLNVLCGLSCAMAPNIPFFLVMRFLLANLAAGKGNCCFVLVNEFVGPKWRAFSSNMYFISWCVGYMVLAGLAYFIREWRVLMVVSCLPELIFYIIFYFFIPESPHWLISRNRSTEAHKVLIRMAKVNRTRLPENLELKCTKDTCSVKTERSFTTIDVFGTPHLRLLSLNLLFNWFAEGFVYYGLSLNTSNLGGNPFLNLASMGAIEMPIYIILPVISKYLGRIVPFSGCLILAGVSLLATAPVPTDTVWLIICLSMIGKFFITASFSLAWTYSCEAYPTCIRNQGVTITGLAARIAAVLASYVSLLAGITKVLPFIVFGGVSIAAGLLVLLLPETKDKPLRQSIQEAETFIKNNKLWNRNNHSIADYKKDEYGSEGVAIPI